MNLDTYQKRANLLLKLLNPYLANPPLLCLDLIGKGELHICLQDIHQDKMIRVLRSCLNVQIHPGKDRLGQANGYLVLSLDNACLNSTAIFSAALDLQRFDAVLY